VRHRFRFVHWLPPGGGRGVDERGVGAAGVLLADPASRFAGWRDRRLRDAASRGARDATLGSFYKPRYSMGPNGVSLLGNQASWRMNDDFCTGKVRIHWGPAATPMGFST